MRTATPTLGAVVLVGAVVAAAAAGVWTVAIVSDDLAPGPALGVTPDDPDDRPPTTPSPERGTGPGPTTDAAEPTDGVGQGIGAFPTVDPAPLQAPRSVGGSRQASCNYTQLYRDAIGSVVQVRTTDGLGSGFVFDRTGPNGTTYVVTNEHVVGQSTRTVVAFSRGEHRVGTVLGTTALTDLAVVAVENAPEYATPLPLAETDPRPGQYVAAMGSPFGLERTITSGIVSGVDREMPTDRGFTIPDTVQTDAPINPGNSGGPLVACENGTVLGVNRAGGGDNVGFAIPARIVDRVVPGLIENGSVEYPYLGAQTVRVTDAIAQANDLPTTDGVIVVDTLPGTPASAALQGSDARATVAGQTVPVGGDVVLAVDDRSIDTREQLTGYLLTETRPGETVTLTVLRDGERTNLTVTLAERPSPVPPQS